MSSVQSLREFISERLTAAAEEIFTEFEKNIVQYEEEIDRQRRLLEISWKPQINLHRIELSQLCNQERTSNFDQKEPEHPHIKIEEESEPPLMKENHRDLKLPHIKKEREEQIRSWEEPESSVMEEEQETDTFMGFSANRRSQCESEANRNHILSQNSAEAESQGQERGRTVDPGFYRDEELRLNNRRPQARCISNNGDSLKVKGEQKKPFLCMTCGKRFRLKYGFTLHMRIHTGEKLFLCQICGKKFNKTCHLINHIRSHTGEKPFICQICGKGCSQKSNLTSHMKTHKGERPVCLRSYHCSENT